MVKVNNLLKILFAFCALFFLFTLTITPSSNCDKCELEYKEKIINGHTAYVIFEDACISYAKPWQIDNSLGDVNLSLEKQK